MPVKVSSDDLPPPDKIFEDIYDKRILVDPEHTLDSLKHQYTELNRISFFVH